MSDQGAAGSAILDPIWGRALLEARRAGVPPSMVQAVAEHRLAGDWSAACEAGAVDVRFDLDEVRQRFGPFAYHQILRDLRCFAPDLLRWHLPRSLPSGAPQKGLVVSLAEYPAAGGATLVVRTPGLPWDAGERLILELVHRPPVGRRAAQWRIVHHRHLWDADQSSEYRSAESKTVQLQDAGEFAEAWWRAGVHLGFAARHVKLLRRLPVDLDRLSKLKEPAVIRPGGDLAIVLEPRTYASGVDAYVTNSARAPRLPVLPRPAWCRPVDHELVRLGLASPSELHPLVASVFGSSTAESPNAVKVRCQGSVHHIRRRHGRWISDNHDLRQEQAELFLTQLGGPAAVCHRVIGELHRRQVAAKARFDVSPRYRSALAGTVLWPAPTGGFSTEPLWKGQLPSPKQLAIAATKSRRGRRNAKPLIGAYIPPLPQRKGADPDLDNDQW